MRTISKIIEFCLLLFCGLLLYSCQKDESIHGEGDIAKVNVIDAVVSGGNAKVNVSSKNMNWNSLPDNQVTGGQVLGGFSLGRLFIVPTNRSTVLQVVPVNDTTKMWYDKVAQLNPGKIYTLYLSGTPTDVKTLLQEETDFPNYVIRDPGRSTPVKDSIVNIRFVNLSPSGPKVNINILNSSSLEASDLGYQQYTNFKSYPARTGIDEIFFEIRKSSDNMLVMTYRFNIDFYRFKSVAVVMMGIYPTIPTRPFLDNYRIAAVPYQ